MKKFYLALIILTPLFSACNFSISPQSPPPKPGIELPPAIKKIEWKEFVSEEGRFKILFPGIPRQTFKENDTQAGKAKTTIFELPLSEDYFEIRYGDFPVEPDVNQNDLKPYYNFIRDNTLRLQQSTLLSERDISINEKLGRELVTNYNGTYIRHWIFLIGRRVYQASTRVEISRKDDSQIQERSNMFLDSLQFLEN